MDPSPGGFDTPPPHIETTVPTVPLEENARHHCDCHRLAVDGRNNELKQHFTEQMKGFGQSRGYANVAALLLSWEDTDLEKMDDEIDRLHDVFRNQYHFAVTKAKIGAGRRASWTVQAQLISFLLQHDSNNALIIVYYAGHGMRRSEDGEFELSRTSIDDEKRKKCNTLVWGEIEHRLHETEADLLVIFDCCYAGALAYPPPNRSQTRKIFSFVLSTGADQTALGPGADSFTSALIHSLHQLKVKRPDGFSVLELLGEVQRAPHFSKTDQRPSEGYRGPAPGDQRLKIRALEQLQDVDPAPEVIPNADGIDDIQHLLRLSFAFIEPPTEDHISEFVFDLAHMIKTSSSPVKNVSWDMLAKRTKRISMREAAWAVLRQQQRRFSSMSTFGGLSPSGSKFELLEPAHLSDYGDGDSTAVADSSLPEQQHSSRNSPSSDIDKDADCTQFRVPPEDHEIELASRFSRLRPGSEGRSLSLVSVTLMAFVAGVYVSRVENIWRWRGE